MNTRLFCLAFLLTITSSALASAQTDVGIQGVGLLSLQPIDDSYVGSPYLSEGIGGVGPGFGGGVNVITSSGFTIGGEYTTARYEQEQNGRLVLGPFPLEQVTATTRLNDSLFSILAGYTTRGSTRVAVLGGISLRLDRPTIDDEEAEAYDNDENVLPVGLTGGVDTITPIGSRAQMVFTARYTFNQRDTRQQYLGIGPHIIRAGAGIRIRLN